MAVSSDYKGPVGHEKKEYRTHFPVPEVELKKTRDSKYEWVETSPGRWRRVKKEIKNG